MSGGLLVALTGVDGAGKSTVGAAVCERLRDDGIDAALMKLPLFSNPGYRHFGPSVKWLKQFSPDAHHYGRAALILLETVRFAMEDVVPAVRAGKVVICDRYVESTRCYLNVNALSTPETGKALEALPAASMTVFLDLPVEASFARRRCLGETIPPAEEAFIRRMNVALRRNALAVNATVLDACAPIGQVVDKATAAVRAAYP